jgi:hypothetical protein
MIRRQGAPHSGFSPVIFITSARTIAFVRGVPDRLAVNDGSRGVAVIDDANAN